MTSLNATHTDSTTRREEQIRERKSGLSCAECRRSKLKCDRAFPCQSCIRRGCAAICPEGTLAATKGNKVLAARTQKLTEKVKDMSAKIQELEIALAQARGQPPPIYTSLVGSDEDPAGRTESDELEEDHEEEEGLLEDMSKAIGSLSVGSSGQVKYFGETASSEYFQSLLPRKQDQAWYIPDPNSFGFPYEIVSLMNAFPFGLQSQTFDKGVFLPFLPTHEKALDYMELYYKFSSWMYDPIKEQDFRSTILEVIYDAQGRVSLDNIHSHELSVFFILVANGVIHETGNPVATPLANQYHALSRAALTLDSILIESTCATVQSLFMMYRYMLTCDRVSHEVRWLLAGLCARVAQSIGLQRDSACWKLSDDEIQRRRNLFWEVYTYDSWMSLINGRPPALMIQHTDARFPEDVEGITNADGKKELGFHAWKFRYSSHCLSAVVHHILQVRSPPYTALLQLDKRIRAFPVPSHLQLPEHDKDSLRSWSLDPTKALQQYCILCERESNLMFIHRSYFAQALRETPSDPLQHKYTQSVQAVIRSSLTLIRNLKEVYRMYPNLVSKPWFFWSGIYSSCIILGGLVIESPGCALADEAYHELLGAVPFFEEGSTPCRPPDTLCMLQKLHQRASDAMTAYKAGFRLNPRPEGDLDELAILRGQRSLITDKSSPGSLSSLSFSSSPSSPSRATSEGIATEFDQASALASCPGAWDWDQHLGAHPIPSHQMHPIGNIEDMHNHTLGLFTEHKPADPNLQHLPNAFRSYWPIEMDGLTFSQPNLITGDEKHTPSSNNQFDTTTGNFTSQYCQSDGQIGNLCPSTWDSFQASQVYDQPLNPASVLNHNYAHQYQFTDSQHQDPILFDAPSVTNQNEYWSNFLASFGLPPQVYPTAGGE